MPNIHDLTAYLINVATGLDPDAWTVGAKTGSEIDAQNYSGGKALFIVQAGTLGASATLDFKVQSATASGGSFADISGASITQLTQAGGDSDSQVLLEVDIPAGRPFLKGIMTVGVATSDCGVACLLYRKRQG